MRSELENIFEEYLKSNTTHPVVASPTSDHLQEAERRRDVMDKINSINNKIDNLNRQKRDLYQQLQGIH